MVNTNSNPKEIPLPNIDAVNQAPPEMPAITPEPAQPEEPLAPPEMPTIPEAPAQPERPAPAPSPEQRVETVDQGIDTLKKKLRRPKKKKPSSVPQVRDEVVVKVEKIMEEGLGDAFKELTPVQQQEFKIKGEETAFKIRSMMGSAKVKVKNIFKLILEWLKILPGINIFFLEQEAKIRADKIMALKDQYFPKK